MEWNDLQHDVPVDSRLVLVVFEDATKGILSWSDDEEAWFDQHDQRHDGPSPAWWHELPGPPPVPVSVPVPAPSVHILKFGRPLCDFHPGLPSEWPAGNRWVGFNDADLLSSADCPACVRKNGFPECSACRTTRVTSDSSRVEYGTGDAQVLLSCVGCGNPTGWRTCGDRPPAPAPSPKEESPDSILDQID